MLPVPSSMQVHSVPGIAVLLPHGTVHTQTHSDKKPNDVINSRTLECVACYRYSSTYWVPVLYCTYTCTTRVPVPVPILFHIHVNTCVAATYSST